MLSNNILRWLLNWTSFWLHDSSYNYRSSFIYNILRLLRLHICSTVRSENKLFLMALSYYLFTCLLSNILSAHINKTIDYWLLCLSAGAHEQQGMFGVVLDRAAEQHLVVLLKG